VAMLVLLAPTAWGQGTAVLHSGEAVFTISVRGSIGVRFSGSCLSIASNGATARADLKGTVPARFDIAGKELALIVQNQSAGAVPEVRLDSSGRLLLDERSPNSQAGSWLEVEIEKNGAPVKRQRTNAPYGVVSLKTQSPPGGSAINTEFQVEGGRYALVTLTSETGDTEQQLVPVPFDRVIYPPKGSIVSLTAQKVRVTRPDPAHADGTIEVMDDGRLGELSVLIRINGQPIGSAKTSEPFGVASTTVKVP
jgi:hypothetical protein